MFKVSKAGKVPKVSKETLEKAFGTFDTFPSLWYLYFTLALGEADFVLPDLVASFPFGLAEADAEAETLGLGSKLGDGATDGAITTSGEGVGSGCDVTLSLNQTKYVPSKIIINMITTIVILRLIISPPPDSLG